MEKIIYAKYNIISQIEETSHHDDIAELKYNANEVFDEDIKYWGYDV